ncbi:MAG TPA: MOSC domain-containing protein [bacterium]|jgi:MOSC domain-containing protein YiiM
MTTADILAVCRSEMKGTSKENVGAAQLIEHHGVENDAHAGFGHRQVSLIGIETHQKLIDKGFKVEPGNFGENITTKGVVLNELPIGTTMKIGEVELEVSQIGKSCHLGCDIRNTIGDCPMPREGIFAIVKKGGEVSVGDKIEII